MDIEIDGVKINVVRKNVKRFRLSVGENANVTLVLPAMHTIAEAEAFAREHAGWLKKHLARAAASAPGRTKDYLSGKFYLFGKAYDITVTESKKRGAKTDGDRIILSVPVNDLAQRTRAAEEFYAAALISYAEPRAREFAEKYGFSFCDITVRKMKSRWGVCNYGTNRIKLNLRLAEKSFDCIDYVIMHELIHTIAHDHGKNFYAVFDKVMPCHRKLRDKLNGKT